MSESDGKIDEVYIDKNGHPILTSKGLKPGGVIEMPPGQPAIHSPAFKGWLEERELTRPDPTEKRCHALIESIKAVDECQCFRQGQLKAVAEEKLKRWIEELDRLIMGEDEQTPSEIVKGMRKGLGGVRRGPKPDIDLDGLAEEVRKA